MATRAAVIRVELDDAGAIRTLRQFGDEGKRSTDLLDQGFKRAGSSGQVAGGQIFEAWQRVAQATVQNQAAQQALQAAMQSVKSAGDADTKTMLALAQAQQAAAQASSRLAAAQKDAAAAGKQGEEAFNGIESAERRGHIAGQLIGRTLGIEVPRSLETVMSRSQLLGPIFASAFSVGIFLAAGAAIFEVGKKIAEAAESAGGMTERVKELAAEMHKANQEKFWKPELLKDAESHLGEINKKTVELRKISEAPLKAPGLFDGIRSGAMAAVPEQTMAEKKLKALTGVEGETNRNELEGNRGKGRLTENQRMDELMAKKKEAGLKGLALLRQQHDDELKLLEDTTLQAEKQTETYYAARRAADAKYAAGLKEINRQSAQETMVAQDKVAENAVHDENRINLAEKDRIKELRAEMAERLGISQKEVDKRADFQAKVAAIHQDASEKIKAQELEVMKIQQQTNDQVSRRAESYLVGTAKILVAQQRELKGVQGYRAEIAKTYSNEQSALRAAKEKEAAENEVSINMAAAEQIKEAHKKAAEEILAAQEETALAQVPLWQRGTAQIEIQLTKRLKSVQEEAQKEIDSLEIAWLQHPEIAAKADAEIIAIEQETQARRVAIWDQANLKIREEHKRQVEQLGSELESVFNDIASGNIGQRILNNMKKLFSQIVAEWILSMGQMKSGAGSLLGSLIFGPGSTGAGAFGGGGGGAGNVMGGLFGGGGLFSGSSPTGMPAGGTPPFISGGTAVGTSAGPASFSGGSTATNPFSLFMGSMLGGGSGTTAGTASSISSGSTTNMANALGLGGFFGNSSSTSFLQPGGPLSTKSLADTIGSIPGIGPSGTQRSNPSGLLGLGNLLHGGVGNALVGIGGLLAPLLGMAGGTSGMIGGTLLALGLTGKLSGLISTLYGSIGMTGAAALLGGATGGLIGFGLGQKFGSGIGALGGAGTGALTGLLVGGPIGAIIGGIIGLLGGIFGGIFGGSKRKKQANQLADTLLPDIKKILDEYKSFQLTGPAANQQLDQIEAQAKTELGKLKGEGRSVLDKKVEPAIADARKQIAGFETERNRRSGLVFGPPQFHEGGFVSATVQRWNAKPNELMAVLKDGEYVINPQATSKNLKTLQRINAGETLSGDIGDVHMHFYERVDDVWFRNKGMQMMLDTLRRARREGLA